MRAVALVLASMLVVGCATNPAPAPYRVSADDYPRNPFGSWVVIKVGGHTRSGELIAVVADGVYIAAAGSSPAHLHDLALIRWNEASEIKVYAWDNGDGIAGWGLVGVLSTISHGFFLVFSAPIWTLSAAIANAAASYGGHFTFAAKDKARLVHYTRFPQGLPPSWLPAPAAAPAAPEPAEPEPAPAPAPEPEPAPAPEPNLPGT